ncbi:PhnB protein [Mucilaginibacter gracilis]|uniref:PhnB protein n=1 Tax=Mucilaginibacter gracilis TaxID=423350 RepID=A0A495J537_9SPHI|nr:VOC family protein [Mucilaginibacter gracilis]RKR83863.1 PhnB protein [Mucilaginibacter gracilis]
MPIIHPYLTFPGNAEEAFNFYKSVFGGEFTMIQRYKDISGSDNLGPEDADKVMHIGLPIGNGNILMASDAVASMGKGQYTLGDNYSLSLGAQSEDEADRLFNGLSAGGQVTMPLQKTFWGAYFGMWTDKFGMQWMVNYDYNEQQ